ncbi:hypothetical protein SEA_GREEDYLAWYER_85 [Mycobacterium phage GreedyLawyer]|nr:hypothetical protein SEA_GREEDYLAWYER_85 [Mycobacterium phage GreedyLawyer]
MDPTSPGERQEVTVTTDINEAKNDLDHILGEVRRAISMMSPVWVLMHEDGRSLAAQDIAHSLDTIEAKARKVRASL